VLRFSSLLVWATITHGGVEPLLGSWMRNRRSFFLRSCAYDSCMSTMTAFGRSVTVSSSRRGGGGADAAVGDRDDRGPADGVEPWIRPGEGRGDVAPRAGRRTARAEQ